jgi:hypothetical protein
MKAKPSPKAKPDELRAEYDFDFSRAARGRYADRIKKQGTNIALLEPELAKSFPDSASVNAALRSVVEIARLSASVTEHVAGRGAKRKAA